MKFIVVVSLLLALTLAQNYPVWAVRFQQEFVESYTTSSIHSAGKLWFDSERAMERLDRNDGRIDPICGPLSKKATTPCTQLVRDAKRWIIFPLLRQCCYCCDAAHGFGVMRRDWLKNAEFKGKETILGQDFNHWAVDEAETDFWETVDGKHTPRRIMEDKLLIKDLIMNTYSEEYIAASVFDLP